MTRRESRKKMIFEVVATDTNKNKVFVFFLKMYAQTWKVVTTANPILLKNKKK